MVSVDNQASRVTYISPDLRDKWCTWLDTETSYSMTKFSTPEQLEYFRAGVDRGDFSWASSAANYMNRAVLLKGQINEDAQLRRNLSLGKSMHNQLACAAVARLNTSLNKCFLDAYFDVQQEWAAELCQTPPETYDEKSASRVLANFVELQKVQDEIGDTELGVQIRKKTLPFCSMFIQICELSLWPQPGRSSSEDVKIWQY